MMPLRVPRLRGVPAQALAAALVAAALVAVGARQVPLRDVGAALDHATPGLLAAAALAALGFVVARAWRFRVLLSGIEPPPFGTMLVLTLAAWGPGLVLPGVASDVGFIWLTNSRLRVSLERGAAAAFLARLLDVASLLVVSLLSAPLAGVALPDTVRLAGVAGALAMAAGTAAVLWAPTRRWLLARLRWLPLVGRRMVYLDAALTPLGRPRAIVELVLSTAAARVFTALQYMALFAAVGQALGFWQAWFALSVRTLLLALPVQGVGGLGTTQLWWVTALVLLGEPLHRALAVGVSVHLLDLLISLLLAGAGWIALIPLRQVAYQRT